MTTEWSHLSWIKLLLGVVIAVAGVLTQFDITVRQDITKPSVKRVAVAHRDRIEKKGEIPEGECYDIKNGDRIDNLLDTYGVPSKSDDYTPGFDLNYPLAGKDGRWCSIDIFDGKVDGVSVDLTNVADFSN